MIKIASLMVADGEISGSLEDIMLATLMVKCLPRLPDGWEWAKSCRVIFLRSIRVRARVSPRIRAVVELELGASLRGHASCLIE